MSRRALYRRFLCVILVIAIFGLGKFTYEYIKDGIPDCINISVNKEEKFQFDVPISATISSKSKEVVFTGVSNIPENEVHLSLNEPFQVQSDKIGNYQLNLKLFGLFHIKDIEVNVVEKQKLIPCGFPIGLYLHTNGVMVIGTGTVSGMDGLSYEPAYGVVKSGDYIVSINGEDVNSKSQLIYYINKYGADEIVLGVMRNEELIKLRIIPVSTGVDEYKLGIWVRDDTQGIGTLTYITEDGKFAALGHGISDIDTGELLSSTDGTLYKADIWGIKKGESGSPGGLCGVINYEEENALGHITNNTSQGIFGSGNDQLFDLCNGMEPMEIGFKQEVELGEASIRCCIDGNIKDYSIDILKVDLANNNINKGMIIQITDPELLSMTNGIIQGMSGSPIIQNNKIIGAVTHVFIQDSTKGYGIFIENMIHSQN